MNRVTISLDAGLAAAFDELVQERGYKSRSEAVRDLVRSAVDARDFDTNPDGPCVAALSYIYDHKVRDLAARLTAIGHDHHDLIISTTHVHLDHSDCLETTILKGPAGKVRDLANSIKAERGVKFGALNLVGVELSGGHLSGLHHHGEHGHVSTRRT